MSLRYINLQECLWLVPHEEDSELNLGSEGSRIGYRVDPCSAVTHIVYLSLSDLQLHQSCPKQRI